MSIRFAICLRSVTPYQLTSIAFLRHKILKGPLMKSQLTNVLESLTSDLSPPEPTPVSCAKPGSGSSGAMRPLSKRGGQAFSPQVALIRHFVSL